MNRKEVASNYFLGKILGFFAPMNGGKTQAVIDELDRAKYYGLTTRAYNPASNTRELDAIVVDGKKRYPAKTVGSIAELRDDLDNKVNRDVNMIAIDEINLFCLSEEQTRETLNLMSWCKGNDKALLLSGLLYDFRHLPFGQVHAILPYVDIKSDEKPACMGVSLVDGPCKNTAQHTQRVWSMDFLEEMSLGNELKTFGKFCFQDKSLKVLTDYVAAPFFDKTLRIEETNDGRVKYLPVCTDCADIPFKDETVAVYNSIVQGDATFGDVGRPELSAAIFKFLEEENWVRRDNSGTLRAVPFYRNIVGGFSTK
ncbi:MAG: hypothetical protein Q8Q01_00635 [archaeon]|nr:hypothetical protein [archaeon]